MITKISQKIAVSGISFVIISARMVIGVVNLTPRLHKRKSLENSYICVILESRLSFPATEPPDARRVAEGSLKGSLKGFRRGQARTLQNPFKNPSKTLQRPLQRPFRDPFKNPSDTLLGSGGSVAGNESLVEGQMVPPFLYYPQCGVPNWDSPVESLPSLLCLCLFLSLDLSTSWRQIGCTRNSLKTLTSLNKEVRPFFLSDTRIWSFPSVSDLSDYSIWRSWRLF